MTWCKVGRLCGSTRGSGPEPVVKQVAQSAQAEAEVLQGNWSGGGHCCPWGSSLQQWGSPGLSHDRKSSSQLAGGSAMKVLPGSRAAALTCMSSPLVPVNPSLTVQSQHSNALMQTSCLQKECRPWHHLTHNTHKQRCTFDFRSIGSKHCVTCKLLLLSEAKGGWEGAMSSASCF